ncbi:MAG: diguanylate cyclase [Synergistaceae bacterium]|nr:diguanylate cyclase [Synergistaceae bacterium]
MDIESRDPESLERSELIDLVRGLKRNERRRQRELLHLRREIEEEKTIAMAKANQQTARRMAQRELERHLSMLLRNSANFVILLDKSCKLVYCSTKFVETTGHVSESELIGRSCGEIFASVADDAWCQRLESAVNRSRTERVAVSYRDATVISGEGLCSFTINISPMEGDGGTIEGMLLLLYNITEIENARHEAERANRAKSDFLAGMSHEIRTPMNSIIGMTYLMRTDNLDETQQQFFAGIQEMSHALLQIVNDILDFSKIEAGKFELLPVHYRLHLLFNNICSLFRYSAETKGLEFIATCDEDLPPILFGDEIRVRQIVTNVLSNAVKYTERGGVELAFEREERDGAPWLLIRVQDTGIGIREEDLDRLFGMFEQVDRYKNRSIVGTGLGLPITKHLLDMMGGEIAVESEYGSGTCFTLRIPLLEGDPSKTEPISRERFAHAYASGDVRVLVVDDNAINLTVALGYLLKHGIRAERAESGRECLAMVRDREYDLVFMDHMMPDMDGLETTRRIREMDDERFRLLPIVALSANAIIGVKQIFIDAGMNDYISKPIDPRELNRVLMRWLPGEKLTLESPPNTPLPIDDISTETGENKRGAKQKILIVDDENTNVLALSKILSGEYAVFFAKTGEDAIRLAKRNQPDLILLDVVMPGMSGFDVLLHLKNDVLTMDTPVIFITGLAEEADEERGFTFGAVDYIKKPFHGTIVRARINTHLQIVRQMKMNRELGLMDPLTGIANRRRFNQCTEVEWKKAIREKRPISFLMLDLDNFKTYNDTYGHPQGDALLRAVAGILSSAARRPADLSARLGGEEFGVLMPDTNLEAALRIAEKIRAQIEETRVPTADGGTLTRITVSIGACAAIPRADDSLDDFLAKADANLYQAKDAGRNRVYPPLLERGKR